MDDFGVLQANLKSFIRRYYLNKLLRGLIFYIAAGLLYLLLILFIEHLFWFRPMGRTILFWTFIMVEIVLFSRFLIYPLLKLFRISKGINDAEASILIGKHFPEVKDKLLNVLQLEKSSLRTELLIASIDQKARELKPIPFSMAVDFKKNLPYLKYVAVPVLIVLLTLIVGETDVFSNSYDRVVNYKTAYEPPAPFSFRLNPGTLKVMENEPLILEVFTEGNVIPEDVTVHYRGQNYLLKTISPGVFQHSFEPVQENIEFYLSGNKVTSPPFLVEVIKVPRILDLQMDLDFPAYTKIKDQRVEGTGNASVPEGTLITWALKTNATNKVQFKMEDSIVQVVSKDKLYTFSKLYTDSEEYQISTSNQEVKNFENLQYSINVVKDEFPNLDLEHQQDTIDKDIHYFYGKFSDDFGISKIHMVVTPIESLEKRRSIKIDYGNRSVGDFLVVFPDTLSLERGQEYEIYFEVFDNDGINGSKKVKSESFFIRKKTWDQEKKERLKEQNDVINDLNGSLEEFKKSQVEWQDISRLERQIRQGNFKDRQEYQNFLERQKKQNQLMQSYTDKLERSFRKEENSYNEGLKKELENRIKNYEDDLIKNEKVLKELEKYADKLEEEGLKEKLEENLIGVKGRERNLEQLLELTKRYYVKEKLHKLGDDLEKLGKQQENLAASGKQNTAAAQDSLSQKTKVTLEELKELEKENKNLKEPIGLGRNETIEKNIIQDQKEAFEELKKGVPEKAKEEQQNAAEKMKELSSNMKQQMQMAGMQQMQEDVNMLRKILDNLIVFSFIQEEVMEEFKKMGTNNPSFSSKLREQNILKENFQHIDDSIYSLALRNPMITEKVTSKLVDVGYHIEKALERLAQNEVHLGVGSQQYTVTGANDLAYFLSTILSNMHQMIKQDSGRGERGAGQEMQLSDIIKKQRELNEEMNQGLQKGEAKDQIKGGEDEPGKSEEESRELFRIYQEQQLLRMSLQQNLRDKIKADTLQQEMEKIEKELVEKGFNRKTLEGMKHLEHKLLELDQAEMQQGQKNEREAKTNVEPFENTLKERKHRAKEYFTTTEILNRQTLPLRQIYRLKVKQYFERGDH